MAGLCEGGNESPGSLKASKELRLLAFDVAERNEIPHIFNKEKIAGKKWYCTFMRRHPELIFRQPESISFARAKGFNKENFAARVACQYVPPLIIYKRSRSAKWLEDGAPTGTIVACNPESGYINKDVFVRRHIGHRHGAEGTAQHDGRHGSVLQVHEYDQDEKLDMNKAEKINMIKMKKMNMIRMKTVKMIKLKEIKMIKMKKMEMIKMKKIKMTKMKKIKMIKMKNIKMIKMKIIMMIKD
ncbi:hypothetical protein ANN_05256 [Periplaneta americana]|uniref:Uncharacterized protein n=1 Tax=Periplaneta americana TaxID=6978 RepID=A0ABQ8TCP9_PERAM|nr:hypothetical protein ANN_05256 [Periplaneta americana]